MTFLWRGWPRLARRIAAYLGPRAIDRGNEQERLLSHLAASIPGFLHTFRRSSDGHASSLFTSAGIRDIYGVQPEDVAHDLSPLADLIHPDDRARFYAASAESARALTPFCLEFRVRNPEKGELWVEARSVPEAGPDGSILWHGVTLDITERKQAQTAIHERLLLDEKLSRLTEMAPGALFTLRRSPSGQLSMPWAADKLIEIAGCWPEDAWEDISALTTSIHAGDANAWRQAGAESARTLLPWHSEFRLAHPIRGETWLEWRATPAREPDGGVVWHGFLHDIGERKAAEYDLRMAASVFDTRAKASSSPTRPVAS